jgi:gamma-glutamylcyclotransferase (GGCT)/AIG2-like uncharacterized protein YtfP
MQRFGDIFPDFAGSFCEAVVGVGMQTMPFFVFGTLSEGMVQFGKIRDFIHNQRPVEARGTVYRLKVGYPVMTAGGTDSIPGLMVELKVSDLLLGLLDEFHGYNAQDTPKSLHFREKIMVMCPQTREQFECSAYLFNTDKISAGATRIEGGDWRKSLDERPPMTSLLTEKQKSYILKLGSSSGREIVPIDLSLYRELMNLEIIVDKGRRLALSKLGQEVFRYLSN